jgi:hypothetical protein
MNRTHENDLLKEMASPDIHVDNWGLSVQQLEQCLNAPVFLFDDFSPTKDDEEYYKSIGLFSSTGVPTSGPFPNWRISMDDGFVQLVRQTKPNPAWVLIGIWKIDERLTARVFALVANDSFINGVGAISVKGSSVTHRWKRFSFAETYSDNLESSQQKAILTRWYIFANFIAAINVPNTAIVRVSPTPDPNKHIKWHLARTHYVLLNRKQAQLCQSQNRGPAKTELLRAAHWRGAHFRRLSSGKFKTKRGLLIPVKHAWVGPKEWTGRDDKIYRVVEMENHQNGKHNN